MKKDLDKPQYGDVLMFTCFIYPVVSASIGFITMGGGIIPGIFLICLFIYLPVASLVFACIRNKMKRAHACIVSTFVGLMTVYFMLGIIAFGLLGGSLLDAGIGLLTLCMLYMMSCGIYLFLLSRKKT